MGTPVAGIYILLGDNSLISWHW